MANQGAGTLSVIDPVTHTISGAIPVGASPLGLAADPGLRRLYVTDAGDGALRVVDADTGHVIAAVPVAGAGFPAANTNNRLVYVPAAGGSVAVVNGFTNQLLSAVPVGGTPMAAAVNTRTNLVYVANGTGAVPVINSNTNAIFAEIPLPSGLTSRDVTADPCGNKAYVLSGDGSVAVINGTANSVEKVFRPAQGASAAALDPGLGLLYLASGSQVLVYDLCTLTQVGALPLEGPPPAAQPRRIAVNGVTHLVYVTDANGTAYVADGGTNTQVSAVPSGAQPYDAAVLNCEAPCPSCGGGCGGTCGGAAGQAAPAGPAGGASAGALPAYAFVANQDGTVSVLNPRTHTLEGTLKVGAMPFGIAADPALGLVYVTDGAQSALYALDAYTRTVAARIPLPGYTRFSAAPHFPAVNTSNHLVYVPDFEGSRLAVVDGTAVRNGGAELFDTVAAGSMPTAVAVNPNTNRVYVANTGSGAVSVLNGNTGGLLAEIPLAGAGSGTLMDVAAAPCANLVYAADLGGGITVIDGASNAVTGRLEGGACALALDEAQGLLYAVDDTRAAVTVYDMRTGERAARIPLGGSYARLARVAADTENHLVYVTDEGSRVTYVIDGVTQSPISEVPPAGGAAAPMGVAAFAGGGACAPACPGGAAAGSLSLSPQMLEALQNREPLNIQVHLCGQREGGAPYLLVNMRAGLGGRWGSA